MDEIIKKKILQGDMTSFQVIAITICLVINMMDGFDVLAVAFAAPGIAAEWNLSPTSIGILFSSGFLGMVLGSLFLAPLADKMGRRKNIIICLLILSLGMFASALSQSIEFFALTRFVTGIGIGAMLASLNTIVAEYASDKHRSIAVTFMASGYPLGAVLGGMLTSAVLLAYFDWRAIFIFGGAASLAILPFVYMFLPESISFLIDCRPAGALDKINTILRKLNQPELTSMEQLGQPKDIAKPSPLTLFNSQYRKKTIMLISAFFLSCVSLYFVLSWMPKLIVDIGLTAKNGVTSGVLMNLGGILGAWILGYIVSKVNIGIVMVAFGSLAAALIALMGFVDPDLGQIYPLAIMMGVFMFGAMAGFYVSLPKVYPPAIRATGSGWVIGIGRLGAVVGPLIAGLLIEAELPRTQYFFLMSLPFAAAGFIIWRLSLHKPTDASPASNRLQQELVELK